VKRGSAWGVVVGLMVVVVLALVIAQVLKGPTTADGTAAFDDSPAPPCPFGFVEGVGERARLEERLRATDEGAALLDALAVNVRYCLGEIDHPVVQDGRVLVLDRRAERPARAARVAHLLHHVVHGLPMPDPLPPAPDCDALVARALDREAEAYALEATLRAAFEAPPTRYEFEPAVRAASDRTERVAIVRRYLAEHPDGAPGIDPLGAAYRQRCEAASRRAR